MIRRTLRWSPAVVLALGVSVLTQSCASSGAGVANTRWRPIHIMDRAVAVPERGREPWIVLDPRSKRVTGSGGCNRITGSYEMGRGTLRFGPLISTKMACPSLDTEVEFPRALENTRRYQVSRHILELLDGSGHLLVRLEDGNWSRGIVD